MEGVRRPPHRDLHSRRDKRDHGCGHHPGHHERRPGPARHPHPPGPPPSVALRAPRRWRLHLPGPPGTGSPETPGHGLRTAAGQPHPPAPPERRLRPGRLPHRLPHRLRPPTGDLPQRPGQQGLAQPLPDVLTHCGPTDRGAVHQGPVPALPSPHPVHQLQRERPERGLPPRELRDLQVRAEQQTPDWRTRYAVRSGVEGTVNEFAHGHGMRRCRYRGQPKAHLQHVLTAIAVNIERLSDVSPAGEASPPRPPTAFQDFLDQHGIPRPKSWRTASD
ncbi:transposase [Streptomyces inhibens]|uniref:transposase n=1 Tax=Streptomyces inhibens TaxID=2293571 RepID=UPI001EE758FA|nr:transposase [Streptomyces inhibens]UKY48570.1 transposase [Streptomyces inhibens]